MSALAALDARLRAPAPAVRLATLRLLLGAYAVISLLIQAPKMADFRSMDPERFEPVGLAAVLDGALPPTLAMVLFALCIGAGCAFATGLRFAISGPAFALLYLWVTSYRNSWGMVFHTDNLPVIHALVLGLTPAADALSLDHRAGRAREGDGRLYGWPIRLLVAITVTVYLIAGLAKLRNSGMDWADGEILRNYIAFDCVRKIQSGSIHSPVGAWLVQYAWPFPIIGYASLVMELGAPLSLLSAGFGRAWAICAFAFHGGVLVIMAIAFPYPLSGVAFASLFRCERLWERPFLQPVARWLSPAAPVAPGG